MTLQILEKQLQEEYGTAKRASNFYRKQCLDHLNEMMIRFIAEQELMFIATSDKGGNCDSSIRAGEKGFVKVADEKPLLYPEYRGNGVYASLGNMAENPHVGILMVDFLIPVHTWQCLKLQLGYVRYTSVVNLNLA